MQYSIIKEGDYTIVALSGEVDLYYSPRARKQILRYLRKKSNVLVDLSDVTYIDSSGVATLVEGFQFAKSHKLEFGLIGISDAAMQVLKLARLDKVFLIKNNVQEFLQQ